MWIREAGIEQATVATRCHGANSPEPRRRAVTEWHVITQKTSSYITVCTWLPGLIVGPCPSEESLCCPACFSENWTSSACSRTLLSLWLQSELSFASFPACLSVRFTPSDESFCAVQLALQLVCRTLGSKRIELCSKRLELLRCSARFLAFRLSFPPSRGAALRIPKLTTRSTSKSSRSSQPPTPNNNKPPSST